MRENCLTEKGAAAILNYLVRHDPDASSSDTAVDHLDLSKNRIGEAATILKQLLPQTKLRYLNLAGCMLGDRRIASLMEAVAQCRTLRYLNVANNGAGKILTLAESISLCALEHLVLSWNGLGRTCFARLCDGLLNNTTIVRLDLAGNSLNDECVDMLLDTLKKRDCGLEALDISGNRIQPKGCAAVIDALVSTKYPILQLTMNDLNIGSEGGEKILQVPVWSKVTKISFRSSKILDTTSAAALHWKRQSSQDTTIMGTATWSKVLRDSAKSEIVHMPEQKFQTILSFFSSLIANGHTVDQVACLAKLLAGGREWLSCGQVSRIFRTLKSSADTLFSSMVWKLTDADVPMVEKGGGEGTIVSRGRHLRSMLLRAGATSSLAVASFLDPTGHYNLVLGKQDDAQRAMEHIAVAIRQRVAFNKRYRSKRLRANLIGIVEEPFKCEATTSLATYVSVTDFFTFHAIADDAPCLRNMTLDGEPISLEWDTWELPDSGKLEYDFVSTLDSMRLHTSSMRQATPAGMQEIVQRLNVFIHQKEEVAEDEIDDTEKQIAIEGATEVLRSLQFSLSTLQVSQIMRLFKGAAVKPWATEPNFLANIFILLYQRVRDLDKLYIVLETLPEDILQIIRHRIGTLRLHHPQHCAGKYSLNLSHADDWLLAKILFAMANPPESDIVENQSLGTINSATYSYDKATMAKALRQQRSPGKKNNPGKRQQRNNRPVQKKDRGTGGKKAESKRNTAGNGHKASEKQSLVTKEWTQSTSPDFNFGILEFSFEEGGGSQEPQDTGTTNEEGADSGDATAIAPPPAKATKAAHILRRGKAKKRTRNFGS